MSAIVVIKCPYCGNIIRILHGPFAVSANINVAGSGGYFSISRGTVKISSYRVKCDFCGRKYVYFDFKGNFTFLKNRNFVKYAPQIVEWFIINGLSLRKLPSMVVGVVEPETGVFMRFKRTLRRRFRRPVTDRFIEVIFEAQINNQTRRGVLHGRIYEVKGSSAIDYITLEQATWL